MKNHLLIKIVCFIMFPILLLGQNKKDLNKMDYYNLWEEYFKNTNNLPIKSEYANAYLKKAKSDPDPIFKARAYYLFSLMNENYKAISYMDSVIKYSKNKDDVYFPTIAYYEKGMLLENNFKYKEAISCYLLAEKYALKNNIEYYYIIKLSMAIDKSEKLGEVEEALVLYKQCYQHYKQKDVRSPNYSDSYQKVLFALADAFKSLKKLDSATYYNKLGYKEAKITKNEQMLNLFILNEGANLVLKKKYNSALDSINKAMPVILKIKDGNNGLASYYYKGKSYEGLGDNQKAIKNFVFVDSMYKIKKYITPEFVGGYQFLIAHYKKKGNKERQLYYLNTLLSIDSTFQKNYRELTKKIQKEYVIPHLIADKEEIISSLKTDKSNSYWGIVLLTTLVLGLSYYGYHQNKRRKLYRERFEKIISQNIPNVNNQKHIDESETYNNEKNKEIDIAEEIITDVLKRLKTFELKKGYLNPNTSLQSLAEECKTNSNYLSKIINKNIGKSIVQYLNDLRIDHAVLSLQQENDLKKYTINALGNEFGFNTGESFSQAFYKKTGIKPSYFIKELEKK